VAALFICIFAHQPKLAADGMIAENLCCQLQPAVYSYCLDNTISSV